MDIKEIVNLLYTAIDLAADGGPTAFTDEEYSEMHELLKKIKSEQFGWHPASDPPIVPENNNWISVVAIVCDMDDNTTRATNATFNKDKGWIFPEFSNVLYWSYPPEKKE